MSVVIIGGHDRMVCQYKKYVSSLIVKRSIYSDVGKFK